LIEQCIKTINKAPIQHYTLTEKGNNIFWRHVEKQHSNRTCFPRTGRFFTNLALHCTVTTLC